MAIVPPGNKQIGDYTNIVVTNLRAPIFYNHLTASFVATKDTAITTPAIVPVKNKFISDYTAIIVTKKPVPEMRNLLTVGFVVTREFTPRVETLIMNLKYNTPGELTFT